MEYLLLKQKRDQSHIVKNPSVVYDGKRVLIDGRESDRNPVEQVIAQANWLSKQLQSSTGKQFPIRPVIVFPGWFVEAIISRHTCLGFKS